MNKLDKLKEILKSYGKTILAYSGGVDSSFLAKVAHEVLGDNLLAVTAMSETYPEREYVEAVDQANKIGVKHKTIYSSELKIEGYAENTRKRCYYCRGELFSKLKKIADKEKYETIMYGAIVDDLGDHRPGMTVANQLGIKAPLIEAGLSKKEIRELSKEMGLETWNKPSAACLSSRIPYGTRVTKKRLSKIDRAEQVLINLGFRQLRVRYHGEVARIEVSTEEIKRFFDEEIREKITEEFRKIGFKYTALDLKGYRSGSMNEVIVNRVGGDELN